MTCAVHAQAGQPASVRIGVLSDMSSVYADFQGAGSVPAARMAAEDYMKTIPPENAFRPLGAGG
jgi:branched-chain amino acid transport system substrate-binding protein